MKRKIVLRICMIVLIILWCCTIFGFSAKNGVQSSKSSGRVTKAVVSFCYPAYSSFDTKKQEEIFHITNLIIRKAAHFTEYAVLSLLITIFIMTFDKMGISAIISAVVICTIFAAGDELHQGLVPGRNPAIRDVLIDGFGALAGSGMVMMIYKIYVKHRNGGSYDIR